MWIVSGNLVWGSLLWVTNLFSCEQGAFRLHTAKVDSFAAALQMGAPCFVMYDTCSFTGQ
jgi:hypothetical protein